MKSLKTVNFMIEMMVSDDSKHFVVRVVEDPRFPAQVVGVFNDSSDVSMVLDKFSGVLAKVEQIKDEVKQ